VNDRAALPDALSAAWDHAVEAWDDIARHDEVMRLVAQHEAYAWAASKYRTRAGDPIGDRQIARIRKAAEATMLASAAVRKETAPKPYRAVTAVLIMLIVAAVGGLLYAMVMRDNIEAEPGSSVPAEPLRPAPPPGLHPAPAAPPVTSPATK
jgi:hypothetical protein